MVIVRFSQGLFILTIKLTWFEPVIQLKPSIWSAVSLKKRQLTSMSSKVEGFEASNRGQSSYRYLKK